MAARTRREGNSVADVFSKVTLRKLTMTFL
jgi:hypothetical protein